MKRNERDEKGKTYKRYNERKNGKEGEKEETVTRGVEKRMEENTTEGKGHVTGEGAR